MQLNRLEPLNLMKSSYGKAESNGYFEPRCKDLNSDCCVVRKFYEYKGTNSANASNETNKSSQHHNVQSKELTKEFRCNICLKRFAHLGSLRAHGRLHNNAAPEHICKCCSKSFRWKSNLKVHYAVHNREKLICETCKMVLPIDKIEQHRNQHLNQSLQCQYCDKAYSNQYKLNYHMRSKHQQVNAWQCQYCKESFNESNERQAHIYNQHFKEMFQCQQCQKIFTTQKCLEIHQKIHDTAFESYECDICGQIFSLQRNLYSHIMRHIVRNGNGTSNVRLPNEKSLQKRFQYKLDGFNCKHDRKPAAACQYDIRMGNTSTSETEVRIDLVAECNAESSVNPLFNLNIPKPNVEASKPMHSIRPPKTKAQHDPVSLVKTFTRRAIFDDCNDTTGPHGSLDISAQRSSGGGCSTIQLETIVIDDTDSCSDDENNIIDYSLPKINP